jgi:hypothetical protein
VHGALLVADEDVLDLVLMEERVVDRQHGPARIAEHVFDALVLQGPHHHLGAGHRLDHRPAPFLIGPSSGRRRKKATKKGPEGP